MKMKRLLATALLSCGMLVTSACSVPTPTNPNEPGTFVDDGYADTALRLANLTTIFLNVGDTFNFNSQVYFPNGSTLKTSDYTFRSTNTNVITIDEDLTITAIGDGFCYVEISGPGLKKPFKQTVYVGSVAGHYENESKMGTSGITAELKEDKTFELTVKEGVWHKEDIAADYVTGSYEVYVCFLAIEEASKEPVDLKPLEQGLSTLLQDIGNIDLGDFRSNIYGRLNYEEGVGLKVDVFFHNELVTLLCEK